MARFGAPDDDADRTPLLKGARSRRQGSEDTAPWYDFAWGWLSPLVRLGLSRPLQTVDLPELPAGSGTGDLADRLIRAAKLDEGGDAAAIRRRVTAAIVYLEARALIVSGFCMLTGILLGFVSPIALDGIINFVAAHAAGGKDKIWWNLELGYWYVAKRAAYVTYACRVSRVPI